MAEDNNRGGTWFHKVCTGSSHALTKRNLQIYRAFNRGSTVSSLASAYGICPKRVSQILWRAKRNARRFHHTYPNEPTQEQVESCLHVVIKHAVQP